MNVEDKKKFTDKWFSYLQSQICNQFENLEKSFSIKENLLAETGLKLMKTKGVAPLIYFLMVKFLKKLVLINLLSQEYLIKNKDLKFMVQIKMANTGLLGFQ